jgi:DHA1 family tetracycline resistance protein-like MFS transporter
LAHQSLISIWVLYTEYRYAWSRQTVGISLAVVGVCSAIISGGLVGPYVRTFGERFSLSSGLFYGVLGFAGFGLLLPFCRRPFSPGLLFADTPNRFLDSRHAWV